VKIKINYVGRKLELLLFAIFIAGILKAYLLPAIAILIGVEFIDIPDWISTPGIGHVMTICMGILPLLGIFDFYLRGNELERRKPKTVHLIFAVLMIFGAFLGIGERILIRGDSVSRTLWVLSDTLPSGIAFGLLVPLYKIEKEKRLLLFFILMAFFYFGAPFAGIARVLNPSLSGYPHYEQKFWLDAWFWSDALVNVGWGGFVFWALLKELIKRKSY